MNDEIQQRLKWIKLYQETNNAGLVCLRCGISRPTLRKWWSRYQEQGLDGLKSLSKRPHNSPNQKTSPELEAKILALRKSRNLGARRIQSELLRNEKIKLGLASIINLKSENIHTQLAEWQHYYNWERPHSAHNGKTPMERYFEVSEQTPFSDEVEEFYQAHNERVQISNYRRDLEIAKLKRSL